MQLNYKEYGQGDPIIILHGLFGMLDNWQTIARKLAEQYSIYLVDQRNHGRSPHLPDFNYGLMAEDLAEFMNDNWIHKAHIIGHSMGGKTAMQFAMNYPDMVDKLVVVDIGPQAYQGGHDLIFKALLSLDLAKIESRKEAEDSLALQIEDKGVRQFLMKNLSRSKQGGFEWKMNLKAIHKNYDAILSALPKDSFEGPTLFVKGGRSDYLQTTAIYQLERQFPAARMEVVPDAGHWVHAEAPLSLLEILYRFLEN